MTAADPLAELHALRQRLAALEVASCLPTGSSTAKRRIELFTPWPRRSRLADGSLVSTTASRPLVSSACRWAGGDDAGSTRDGSSLRDRPVWPM
jgi:hypothetical protein